MSAGQESNESWHEHLVCVMFLLLACQAGAFEIREISCNQMPKPIGVDCHQMRFSWKVESKERDYRQQAYQIEIRESTSGRVVWNSGRRESEESVLVPYGGETLKPATTYIYIACVRGILQGSRRNGVHRGISLRVFPRRATGRVHAGLHWRKTASAWCRRTARPR